MDRYELIKARVDAFKKSHLPDFPELSRLLQKSETIVRRALRENDNRQIEIEYEELRKSILLPRMTEDPRFRAYRGFVGTLMLSPDISQIRDDFLFAFSMKWEPEIAYLIRWYRVEDATGIGNEYCDRIVDFVSAGRTYSYSNKLEFRARKASRLYRRGLEERTVNPISSTAYLRKAVVIHSNNLAAAISVGHPNVYKWEQYLRNTWLLYMQNCSRGEFFDDFIDTIVEICEMDVHILDPISEAVQEYLVPLTLSGIKKGNSERTKGRVKHVASILNKGKWGAEDARVATLSVFERIGRANFGHNGAS